MRLLGVFDLLLSQDGDFSPGGSQIQTKLILNTM